MYPNPREGDDSTVALVASPPEKRWRLPVLIAASAAIVLALGVTLVACAEREEPGGDGLAVQEPAPVLPPELEPIILEWDQEVGGAPEPETISLDDAPQTGTALDGPCPGVVGDGLIVTPNPVRLHSAKGAIEIRNCDIGTIDWTASTVTWVSLDEVGGELASGAIFRILFTVDTSGLPTGPYSFIISVNDVDVQVTGTKLGGLVAPVGPTPSPVPTIGGLIAPGVSPCATMCITKAWLTTLPNRADMALEVRTNTPAKIVAQVDTKAPQVSNSGDPYYTDPAIHVATDTYRSDWNVVLKPLQPQTTYHIVVAAEDHERGASYLTTTFTTPKVVDQLAGNEPGGCSTECVSSAQLLRRFGSPSLDIEVTTLVPTRLQVFADDVDLASTGGGYVTEWSALLVLEPGRNYEIRLVVTDEQGRSRQHSALVSTPKPVGDHLNQVLVTFHKIFVHDDADNTALNRTGELTFRFRVDGEDFGIDTGERKIMAPAWVGLGMGRASARSVIVADPPHLLPIRVQALERDKGQWNACFGPWTSVPAPLHPEKSGREDGSCPQFEWNTAETTIDLDGAPVGDGVDERLVQALTCWPYARRWFESLPPHRISQFANPRTFYRRSAITTKSVADAKK